MKLWRDWAIVGWVVLLTTLAGKVVWNWNTWIEPDNTVGIILGYLSMAAVGLPAGAYTGTVIAEWLWRRVLEPRVAVR